MKYGFLTLMPFSLPVLSNKQKNYMTNTKRYFSILLSLVLSLKLYCLCVRVFLSQKKCHTIVDVLHCFLGYGNSVSYKMHVST